MKAIDTAFQTDSFAPVACPGCGQHVHVATLPGESTTCRCGVQVRFAAIVLQARGTSDEGAAAKAEIDAARKART